MPMTDVKDHILIDQPEYIHRRMDDDIEKKDNNAEQTTMPTVNICLDIEFYEIASLSHHHILCCIQYAQHYLLI